MGEQPPFAGLGKLYFCRVGDKDKEPQPLGEAVADEDGDLAVVITYPNNKKLYIPQGMRRAKDLQPHIKRLDLRVIPPCSKKPEGWSEEGIKEDRLADNTNVTNAKQRTIHQGGAACREDGCC